jgi:hypothetical protein
LLYLIGFPPLELEKKTLLMDLGLKDDVAKRHGHDGKIIEVVVMTLSFREPCAVDAIMAYGRN